MFNPLTYTFYFEYLLYMQTYVCKNLLPIIVEQCWRVEVLVCVVVDCSFIVIEWLICLYSVYLLKTNVFSIVRCCIKKKENTIKLTKFNIY